MLSVCQRDAEHFFYRRLTAIPCNNFWLRQLRCESTESSLPENETTLPRFSWFSISFDSRLVLGLIVCRSPEWIVVGVTAILRQQRIGLLGQVLQ
jgi:hypothetical protein